MLIFYSYTILRLVIIGLRVNQFEQEVMGSTFVGNAIGAHPLQPHNKNPFFISTLPQNRVKKG